MAERTSIWSGEKRTYCKNFLWKSRKRIDQIAYNFIVSLFRSKTLFDKKIHNQSLDLLFIFLPIKRLSVIFLFFCAKAIKKFLMKQTSQNDDCSLWENEKRVNQKVCVLSIFVQFACKLAEQHDRDVFLWCSILFLESTQKCPKHVELLKGCS